MARDEEDARSRQVLYAVYPGDDEKSVKDFFEGRVDSWSPMHFR